MNKKFVLTISLLFFLACKKENGQQKPDSKPISPKESIGRKEPTVFWSGIEVKNADTGQFAFINTSDVIFMDLPMLYFQDFSDQRNDTCAFGWQDNWTNLENKKTIGRSSSFAVFELLDTDSLYQSSLAQSSFNIYEVGNDYTPTKLLADVKLDKSNVLISKGNHKYLNLDREQVKKEDFEEMPHLIVYQHDKISFYEHIHNTLAPDHKFP